MKYSYMLGEDAQKEYQVANTPPGYLVRAGKARVTTYKENPRLIANEPMVQL